MAKLSAALRAQYRRLFETCVVKPGKVTKVEAAVSIIVANRQRYEAVAGIVRVPWHVIAAIHNMESTQNFKRHLHNGDPLTARTVQVPKGRPVAGSPPFTWEKSATDALSFDGFDKWKDWSLPGTLYKLETFNGSGYLDYHKGVNSPYLWSFSNHYAKGKYASDGKWDPELVSNQCGAALLLRRMIEKKLFAFSDEPPPAPGAPPLVVHYSATKPTDKAAIAQAITLQQWLTTHTGIYLKPDGWAGKRTSDAYKAVTGSYLPRDPRGH